jgi:hypothetical protein
MKTVGLIPASGNASRLGGLPKFALPISDKSSLLGWHVSNLLKVCDEVRVSTQSKWVPLVESMNLPITLIQKEPSTLSDAIVSLAKSGSDQYIFTMPDTYYVNFDKGSFEKIFENSEEIILGCFDCPPNLRGKVGQVDLVQNRIVAAMDKNLSCTFPFMWGYMAFRQGQIQKLTADSDTPSLLIDKWISAGITIGAQYNSGEYIDVGSFDGVKRLYTSLIEIS